MPRRPPPRNNPHSDSHPPPRSPSPTHNIFNEPLTQLRTQWKWAAFSQFFFTFNHLFAMNDVSLNVYIHSQCTPTKIVILTSFPQDIEEDLVRGSSTVLPRVMQRLLYIVSYDRKVS